MMSSATSIDAANKPLPGPARDDAAFRPWHFFLLASLVLATIAVMLSRQSTPEHLVLISLTIIAAGIAAAGFYRMLAPLAAPDMSTFIEPLTERSRTVLEREKALVLRSIKEIEFDRAMGKISPKDFEEMAGRLRVRAVALMKQLEEGSAGYRDVIERELSARVARMPRPQAVETRAANACGGCGAANDDDAQFCKKCGTRLAAGAAQ
jgi:ribosomal protein L40E